MGIKNNTVYLHEILENMARKLFGCIFYKIIEKGSSNSLNKAVNFMDLLSLIFLFRNPVPPCSIKLTRERRGRREDVSPSHFQ